MDKQKLQSINIVEKISSTSPVIQESLILKIYVGLNFSQSNIKNYKSNTNIEKPNFKFDIPTESMNQINEVIKNYRNNYVLITLIELSTEFYKDFVIEIVRTHLRKLFHRISHHILLIPNFHAYGFRNKCSKLLLILS